MNKILDLDPVLEIRRIREEQAAKFHFNTKEIFADAIKRQADHKNLIVDKRKSEKPV